MGFINQLTSLGGTILYGLWIGKPPIFQWTICPTPDLLPDGGPGQDGFGLLIGQMGGFLLGLLQSEVGWVRADFTAKN